MTERKDDWSAFPWSERTIELVATEGRYADYAAWLEWFELFMAAKFKDAVIEFGGECDKIFLYSAFCEVIDYAVNAGHQLSRKK